jgi:hypothetical protein
VACDVRDHVVALEFDPAAPIVGAVQRSLEEAVHEDIVKHAPRQRATPDVARLLPLSTPARRAKNNETADAGSS